MKRTDFFSLTRPVQERFVAATRGQGSPTPLLVANLPLPLGAIGWGALSALAVIAWGYCVKLGYGQLDSPLALQPEWLLGLEAGLLVVAVLLALQSRRTLRKRMRLPFVPTVYLFPIGAIDARSQNVALHGWEELRNLDVSSSRARATFAHGSFTFPLANASQGEELKARAAEYQQKLGGGGPPEKDLVALDPLRDNGFRNPFSPVDSMRPPKPARLPLFEIGLLLGAVVLASGVHRLRNHVGERTIYERAVTENSIESYRSYLARGGRRTDVSDLHLPRAELRAAVAEKGVPAIERYQASHPNSKIETEVQGALRAALLHALEDAKAKGTITALREFEATNKRHLKLVPELPGARVAYLAGVLERFQKSAKPSKELWLLARRLIVYADQHDKKVLVRFSQQESRTLEKNQKMLTASAYYGGDKTLPSHFLEGEPARQAEKRAGADLAAALGRAFPSDLLSFEVGAPVAAGSPPPAFKEPTIFVSYRLEISSPLVSKKPRGIYSAVGLIALAVLSIPDKEPTTELKHTAWHAPDIKKVEAGELLPENVYSEMLGRAWTKFTNRYAAPWLGQ
jgi:hypothetical protein